VYNELVLISDTYLKGKVMADLQIPTDLRILIVDDMKTMRKIIMNTISQLGLTNFKEAEDGEQALEILNELKGSAKEIQFIFSDINMPNMNGLELLKAVKADKDLKKIPVMMVSAENEVHYLMEAQSNGAEDFLVKPFGPEDLQEKILRALFPDQKNPLSKI
jgi:two-component system chemotaxis response regulator CheY